MVLTQDEMRPMGIEVFKDRTAAFDGSSDRPESVFGTSDELQDVEHAIRMAPADWCFESDDTEAHW